MNAAKGWRYNVGINGKWEVLEIAEVDADIPGLCGPDGLALWNVKLDFTDGTMEKTWRETTIIAIALWTSMSELTSLLRKANRILSIRTR